MSTPPPDSDATPSGPHGPDYELDDFVNADTPEALKALGDPTRMLIISLLLERAATTTHLAEALDKPKGTVGYHLKVLEDAGLVHVVRTRPVRAMTEKYYGRTGRTIVYKGQPGDSKLFMLQEAIEEVRLDDESPLPMFTIRRVRIDEKRAVEFSQRVLEVAEEFVALPRSGDTVYGFVAGVYPTDHPVLPDDHDEESG
ncbi:MAG: winged helix-turn-helix domain-containing protein [Acidimicrobiia bacterium]|nr:winged helix-turn-helix domain-containing protein [Acidimicrobiia bacterium]